LWSAKTQIRKLLLANGLLLNLAIGSSVRLKHPLAKCAVRAQGHRQTAQLADS
jgi:hypothetical protein